MPSFVGMALRFAVAGGVLVAWEVLRGGRGFRVPPLRELRDSAIVGVLLLGIGNGWVAWGERTVPSGIAATLIALVPLWIAVFGWVYLRERVPRIAVVGIALGLAGVGILVLPAGPNDAGFDLLGIAVLGIAPIGWAHGSLWAARAARLPSRPLLATGIQMLAGSAALATEAAIGGEWGRFDPGQVSPASFWAIVYLIVIGSLVGYNAYAYLLRNAPLEVASTYAYVNPVVAVVLGAIVLSEPITPRILVGSGVIVAAVAMIVTARGRASRAARPAIAVTPEEAVPTLTSPEPSPTRSSG